MSVNTTAELDTLIKKATSESIPNGDLDLPPALEISDVIRSRRVPPKESMRCLKKRVMETTGNPNTQLSSWKLVDICIKNGGIPFIKEICSREFMDTMENTIIKSGNNSELQELVSGMFYELYVAFQNDSQLNYVSKVHNKLVNHGIEFPDTKAQSGTVMAMFDSRTPADWVDSDACMICSKKFSLLSRRHHCRSCGGIFCQDHSSNSIVLPDLGIYEPVRVCDNCFEDYDLKKSSKKKHHRNKQSKRKAAHSSNGYGDNEEEDLRRAIELSLKESKSNIEPVIPVMERADEKSQKKAFEEEEDPDLKAAIEASLKEAVEEKKRVQSSAQNYANQSNFATQMNHTVPSYNLTTAEEEDIHLFASLVERMKNQSPSEILEDTQLQTLYQKVIGTRPKLNTALNDTIQKYNMLMEMNTKISDIMNIYDDLLERQLKNINLSERYVIPQVPSDPYTYYNQEPSANVSNNMRETSTVGTIPYQREQAPLPSQNVTTQFVQQPQSLNYQNQMKHYDVNNQNVNQLPYASPFAQSNDHAQIQSQAEQYHNHPPQLHQVKQQQQQQSEPQPQPQPKAQTQPQPQPQQPYLDQLQGIKVTSSPQEIPSSQATSIANVPSEPPYPTAEDEDETETKSGVMQPNGKHDENKSLGERKLSNVSNGRPYPLEEEDATESTQSNGVITNFDFPTVPIKRVSEHEEPQELSEMRKEEIAVPSQSEEPLLLEL